MRKTYQSVTARVGKRVEEFFVREDVSRMTSGKKQTLTRAKNKQQKRFLNDTISNLHMKFLAENSDIKFSYRTFCRLKPFWVVWPKEKDRDTCQCKTHENLNFLAKKLKQEHVISTDHLDELVACIACSVTDKACMYNECVSCKNKRFPFEQHDCNVETTWTQWKTVAEERNIKKPGGRSEIKKVTVVMKEIQSGSIYDLRTEFEEQLQKFKTHYFNIRHQFFSYRQLRKQMKSNEALVHVDFSENYVATMFRLQLKTAMTGGLVVQWLGCWTCDRWVVGSIPGRCIVRQQPWASCSHQCASVHQVHSRQTFYSKLGYNSENCYYLLSLHRYCKTRTLYCGCSCSYC